MPCVYHGTISLSRKVRDVDSAQPVHVLETECWVYEPDGDMHGLTPSGSHREMPMGQNYSRVKIS